MLAKLMGRKKRYRLDRRGKGEPQVLAVGDSVDGEFGERDAGVSTKYFEANLGGEDFDFDDLAEVVEE